LHLQIRPGTDGALALGLMNVIVEEGRQNQTYIDRFTLGFDRLRERIGRFDPRRVSEITSLRTEDIQRAARMIASEGPSSIWPGLGVEHHANSTQTIRAITVLSALCGEIDVPGGNHLLKRPKSRREGKPLPALTRMFTPRPVPPPVRALPLGHDEFPLFEMHNRQAQGNLLARAILDDEPYPVRALVQFGSNSMVTGPGNARMRRAAEKLSLMVSVDPFLTESGRLADYVLPAATFAEGPRPPEGRRVVNSPMIEPRHESRSDWDIIRGLAAALALERYFPWPTLEEAMQAPHDPYMLSDRTILAEPTPEAAAPPRFPTASGKIEIYSKTLERFGHDPLPDWNEPAEESRRRGKDFPFILVTGPRKKTYINSQFRQIPSVRTKVPRPLVEVHPAAARRAGITDGDRVAVVSPHGRIVLHAKITTSIHPECVVVPAGWSDANANLLTSAEELDPVTGFPTLRSGVCRLEAQSAT
jgi:anaerobic selenocysteine-containing dehydrogenase